MNTTIVAYIPPRGRKVRVESFDIHVDKLLAPRSTKIPIGSKILDVGVGESFLEKYTKKYLDKSK